MGRPKRGDAPAGKPRKKAGIGHNRPIDPEMALEFKDSLDEVHTEMEAAMGAFRSRIKGLYADAADKLGVPKKLIMLDYKLRRAAEKHAAKEKDLETIEKERLAALRAALGPYADSPLGAAALSAAGDTEAAAAAEEAEDMRDAFSEAIDDDKEPSLESVFGSTPSGPGFD